MAEAERKVGQVTYRETEAGYFENRKLRRHAGLFALWALGVGAVISGDFSGWNIGLLEGGFGGMLVATVIVTVMYFGLAFSVAEMTAALRHTGGAYSFGRSALGPWGGFLTGLAETMEYVLTPAVIVFFTSAYAGSITEDLFGFNLPNPVWWLIFYAIFVGLNVVGVETSFRVTVTVCVLALGVLVLFFVLAIPKFDPSLLNNVGDGSFLPNGISGVLFALPFAIWFYLAIEELPLAAEEAHEPAKNLPKALVTGILTLTATAFLVLFLNTGIEGGGGAEGIGNSDEPLLDGFRAIFGQGNVAALLSLFALFGLIASFHTIIYAYGRNIYSLSRAGYYPHWMSITHGTRHTPYVALLIGAVLGYAVALILEYSGNERVGAALLTMAVFGGVVSYALQMASYVRLRSKFPDIERPYVSPMGIAGAVVAGIIAVVTLIVLPFNADYRPGVIGTGVWFLAGAVWFYVISRHRLVLSPEEEFAVTGGEHGRPDIEGYGHTHVVEEARTVGRMPIPEDD